MIVIEEEEKNMNTTLRRLNVCIIALKEFTLPPRSKSNVWNWLEGEGSARKDHVWIFILNGTYVKIREHEQILHYEY